jgi:hypothetical protein
MTATGTIRLQVGAIGHSFYGVYDEMARERLDWLDKVFGPKIPAGSR